MADTDIPDEVPKNKLLRYGAYAAAATAILAAITGAWAITGNDAPPLASISRVTSIDQKHEQVETHLLTILDTSAKTMLQIQIKGCQRDRTNAIDDLQKTPQSALAQEELDEANDCVRSLSRQINQSQ